MAILDYQDGILCIAKIYDSKSYAIENDKVLL